MLERMRNDTFQPVELGGIDASTDRLNVDHLLSAIKRQWLIVAISMLVMVVIGVFYLVNATPNYTATNQILIDVNNVQIVDKLTSTVTPVGDAVVTSQIELMMAERIGNRVIDKLNLLNNKAFMTSEPSLIGRVMGWLTAPLKAVLHRAPPAGTTPQDPAQAAAEQAESERETALGKLDGNFSAARVGETYSIQLSYTDPDPRFAVQVVQAFAEAYLVDQLESKYEAQRRASEWMESRIDELRQKSLASDLAVQQFRRDHNLLTTNADGTLLSDQQLQEVSNQLSAAQVDRARAKAKYDQIEGIISAGNVDAVVSDALTSPVVNQLRGKYLDAAHMRTEILPRLGEKHEQVVKLTNEMEEYKRLIFEELGRIGQSYRTDYEIAKSKEDALTERLASAGASSSEANKTQVQLRELEREADSYRTLYQTFLQQLQESKQQQSFPINEARIITNAMTPSNPSSPKPILTLALCVLIGGLIGGLVGAFREFRDTFFRTGEQVREALGMPFLGYLPLIRDKDGKERSLRKAGQITKANAVQDYVVDHPFSAGAETLRKVKVTVDQSVGRSSVQSERPIVIGIVSVLPQEGKSTVSVNLAEMLTMDGSPTILIDCDLRNPSLTKTMARNSLVGLRDCVLAGVPVKDAVVSSPTTGLIMLPTGGRSGEGAASAPVRNTSDFFSSAGMAWTLQQVKRFKYVVLDLPPMGALVDARVVSAHVDAFVLVVEWGKTTRQVVRTTLANEPLIADKCVGVVLNRADMKKMRRYQSYGSAEFYHKRFASYYDRVPS